MKRFTRSADEKVIAGLMGGIAEYLNTDAVFVRLLYVFITIFTGVFPGILAYILGVIIVPPPATPSVPVNDTEAV